MRAISRAISRQGWVMLHRWAGLSTALFLAVAGLTGMALAWEEEIEGWTAPQLLRAAPAHPGQPLRDPAELARAALARHPGMAITYLPLSVPPGRSLDIRVSWPGLAHPPPADELFLNPYTGAELGWRHWGDIGEGWRNLMPFVYRLHYSLLLGDAGELVMGIAALVWMGDCFLGFYLTLPPPAPRGAARKGSWLASKVGWLARWRPAWVVRRHVSAHKRHFDLHRAGGLWVWPVLLVFATSSVSFNLPGVYGPVQRALGGQDGAALLAARALPAPRLHPALDPVAARARGAALAAAAIARAGAQGRPQGAIWLWQAPAAGAWIYGFSTSADIPDKGGASRLAFDSDTGQLLGVALAGQAPAANRFTDWIVALHMARVFGPWWQALVSLVGAAVCLLAATGVLIWLKKREARRRRIRPATPAAARIPSPSAPPPCASRQSCECRESARR